MLFLVSPLGFLFLSIFPQDIPQTPLGSLGAEQIGFLVLYEKSAILGPPFQTPGSKTVKTKEPLRTEFSVVKFGRFVLLV